MTASADPATAFAAAQAHAAAGRWPDALAAVDTALASAPDIAVLWAFRGEAMARQGDRVGAAVALQKCLALDDAQASAHLLLGILMAQDGAYPAAAAALQRACALAPQNADAWTALGGVHAKQHSATAAEDAYLKALTLAPAAVRPLIELAELLVDQGRDGEAAALALRATQAAPENPRGWEMLARAHLIAARWDDAGAALDEALRLSPGDLRTLNTQATFLRYRDDRAAAHAAYDAVLALDPGYAPALTNKAHMLLADGDFAGGWRLPAHRKHFSARPWQGEPLAGRSILVVTEYGLGDEILDAGLVPDLTAAGAQVTLICSARLGPTFARSFPAVRVIADDAARVAPPGIERYDFAMALADCARWFRPSEASFPRRASYLQGDPARVADQKARFASAHPGRRLAGVSWSSASPSNGRFKSTTLPDWTPVFAAAGWTFVNLQYGAARGDWPLPAGPAPEIDPRIDVDGFLAQIAAMDLVISVSNVTLHAAGALGVPAWGLLSEGIGAHWYWLRDRSDSPWYPSLRLFRKASGAPWTPLLRDVGAALADRP